MALLQADDAAGAVPAAPPAPEAEAAPAPPLPLPLPQPTLEFDVVMTDEVPPELAEVFGEEAKEHLETIARQTSRLVAMPNDPESVQELRRAVHTLKGAAGVVGYKGRAN